SSPPCAVERRKAGVSPRRGGRPYGSVHSLRTDPHIVWPAARSTGADVSGTMKISIRRGSGTVAARPERTAMCRTLSLAVLIGWFAFPLCAIAESDDGAH